MEDHSRHSTSLRSHNEDRCVAFDVLQRSPHHRQRSVSAQDDGYPRTGSRLPCRARASLPCTRDAARSTSCSPTRVFCSDYHSLRPTERPPVSPLSPPSPLLSFPAQSTPPGPRISSRFSNSAFLDWTSTIRSRRCLRPCLLSRVSSPSWSTISLDRKCKRTSISPFTRIRRQSYSRMVPSHRSRELRRI